MIKWLLSYIHPYPIKVGDKFVYDSDYPFYNSNDIYEVVEIKGKFCKLKMGVIFTQREKQTLRAFFTKINEYDSL